MTKERITIKGTSSGLVVTIGAGVWQGLVDELDSRLGEKASFFKGGRVALHVGPRQLTRGQLESVGQVLARHGVTLWAVESDSPGTRDAAVQLGLEVGIPDRPSISEEELPASQGDAIVVRRTLRSGQVIFHPGHVVVIGDVNPGAEIRADNAVVCALQLSPTQLRIGNFIARAPAEEGGQEIIPEMASVQNDQIVAEPWKDS
jgi:septum site-determining protein MinC